ncbi:beta-lactamase-like protein, partial [Mycena olivaceomarginata]
SMTVTFLGTCSGGGPNESRNCSSLIVDCLRDGSLWMVDCAEGTIRQFDFQPSDMPVRLKPQSVSKLFITHMHADHTMGVVTMLRSVLF